MKKKHKNQVYLRQLIGLMVILVIAIISIYLQEPEEKNNEINIQNNEVSYNIEDIPEYSNESYVIINNNDPKFDDKYFTEESFENYSNLDNLGRCGAAFANLSKETMPTESEKRTSISHIYPSGWNNKEYDMSLVNGGHLYNRCHLIAYALSAENANEKNLITGTRYFNTDGMLPFETKVINYLKENKNKHVLYRVTPIFEGNNLVASGVIMEAESVEDAGDSISFNVYVYNVQPGIEIDYATGNSKLEE